jgi:hypothetical protein
LTNYPSVLGSANASSSGNITYGPSQPVPFTTSLQIVAVDCGLTLRAYVHYANGSQTILHGKDEINLDITTVSTPSPTPLHISCLSGRERDDSQSQVSGDEEHHP